MCEQCRMTSQRYRLLQARAGAYRVTIRGLQEATPEQSSRGAAWSEKRITRHQAALERILVQQEALHNELIIESFKAAPANAPTYMHMTERTEQS